MHRSMWKYRGQQRPPFAEEPDPGQESVWDYPRPPRLEEDGRLVEVYQDSLLIAATRDAVRVLETASPPTFYLPPGDVRTELLRETGRSSSCEWKGRASYHAYHEAPEEAIAWCYLNPPAEYAQIAGYFSFYPGRVRCLVAGERVRPQPGGFYGGWLTDEIAGPVKGEPGTGGW